MSLRILIVPSVAKGNGSGHIVRCLRLARELGAASAVYLPAAKTDRAWSAAELSLSYARELEGLRIVDDLAGAGAWDLVVLDRRATRLDELSFWESIGPVAALDEGGEARGSASYLVDILPRLAGPGYDGANRSSLGFLDLPRRRREKPASFRRILVSFGGEDPAGLALPLARDLLVLGLVEPADLTLVSGALRRGAPPVGLEGVTVLGPVQDLKEHLHSWDLVFTQFGLTAFEAAWAGCGVILLNPGSYHRALSRAAGFPELGIGRAEPRRLAALLRDPAALLERLGAILPSEPESLAACLGGMVVSGPVLCPACGSRERRALHRNPGRSYFRCGRCGLIYLTRFGSKREAPYTRDYFFDEYRRQYGRTYLDDWEGLLGLAEGRLALVEALAARTLGRESSLSLLDVGCAYGPYLEAARRRGHEPYGIDVSAEAARYVREELGIPAIAGDFVDPQAARGFGGPYDALSMWYVVEHFEDLDAALRNAAALLRAGGILALSTPSGEGISATSSPAAFFEASPEDHFTIWEPSRIGALLAAHGFRLEGLRITGHHPERFPLAKLLIGASKGPLASLLLSFLGWVSRLRGLGDTFEVYASRIGEGGEGRGAPPPREARSADRSGSANATPRPRSGP